MDVAALRRQVEQDVRDGHRPFLVVGTAGTVSTGAVDPLADIAAVCREHGMWFHVDGAYGAVAAQAPGAPALLRELVEADSIAVDPHKWLYAPLEAGCVLVRDPEALRKTFSYHPAYYGFDEQVVNFFEYGPQNSRGFRALKVWLALQQAGRDGYLRMIADDMRLAAHLFACLDAASGVRGASRRASASPRSASCLPDLRAAWERDDVERYLDRLNRQICWPPSSAAARRFCRTPSWTAASPCAPASSTSTPRWATSRRCCRSSPGWGHEPTPLSGTRRPSRTTRRPQMRRRRLKGAGNDQYARDHDHRHAARRREHRAPKPSPRAWSRGSTR